ncbi:MAG: sigma-54-dependent Fis family transcriptional regulator [Candidatus Riflebacteria bacterium]|nr:sigma-54-dependent Fis family transcriptional regulator [Candidatus Riflebacteria bacterium]
MSYSQTNIRILGSSQAMQEVFELLERIGSNDVTVLITGESGTGKELVAQALHRQSLRKSNPFVKINCAALPENLIESELFGYEKGAFTGAFQRKPGKFEIANHGTIFLDEIGEMNLSTQVKLLRVLQEREFVRVGGIQTLNVDTRVIAATNKDLFQCIALGTFREDLFYRLNVINIHLPPLKERLADIPELVDCFSRRYHTKFNKEYKPFSKKFMGKLMQYSWPGNVRELQNLIEKVVVLNDESVIDVETGSNKSKINLENKEYISEGMLNMDYKSAKEMILESFEKEYFTALLNRADGNISEAARISGMHRKNLFVKLRNLGLK